MLKKILIIKTSSMGDVIHTLPALTDALAVHPQLQFDWVVEKSFQEIPAWHKAVAHVIPLQLRQWRKTPFKSFMSEDFKSFVKAIRKERYDYVIDAQGLVKSAWLTRLAHGTAAGFNWRSAREKYASIFYQKTTSTDWNKHAVVRMRQLFADILNYPMPTTAPDYGIDASKLPAMTYQDHCVFLHGTTWETKHWPEQYWCDLAKEVSPHFKQILLPWGNEAELTRAQTIATHAPNAIVLPKMALKELAAILAQAKLVYAVDTGLGHLAAALHTPTISLFGATNPTLTGAYGKEQYHLAAQFTCAPCLKRQCQHADYQPNFMPCYKTVTPNRVLQETKQILPEVSA